MGRPKKAAYLKLVVAAAVMTVGLGSHAQIPKFNGADLEKKICSDTFELDIEVQPASEGVIGARELSLSVRINNNGRKIASINHVGHTKNFTHSRCVAWEQSYWAVLDRIIFENRSAERSQFACENVASVNYLIGGSRKSAKICLGDAAKDAMTFAFYQFYEATAELAGGLE